MMPVDSRAGDRLEFSAGLSLAQTLEAHLEAVFVRPDPDETFIYLGLAPLSRDVAMQEMRARMDARGKTDADRFRRSFGASCRKAGIPKARRPERVRAATASWRTLKGEPNEVIPAVARSADLSLFTASRARYSPLFENLLEVTLLRSGRPVLFVPAGCEILPLRRALIAWDSSSGCARAVSAWLDLAGESATASLLHVEEQIGGDAPDMSEVLTHLGWHAVAAETETVARGSESIGGILLQAAESADADLVVMGGYGRARYREALLGGVTKHVIRQARVPVLMAH